MCDKSSPINSEGINMGNKKLEEMFEKNLKKWKEHCYKNSMHSVTQRYLDCNAYTEIITMGPEVLPLIREQLNKEHEISMKSQSELLKVRIRVFRGAPVNLSGENYSEICEDAGYQEHERKYRDILLSNPGIYWCHAIKEIVPEFKLSIGEKDSGQPIEKRGAGFVALDVDKVKEATIKWLDKNMSKYLPK